MSEGRVQLFLNARLKHSPGCHRTKAAYESRRTFQLDLVILKKENKLILRVFSPWRDLRALRLTLWTGLW